MVMSKNVFCYGEFLETPKCVKSSFDILQSFVDFRNSKVFLLTTANILKIQTFSKDPTSLQPLNEIHEVSQFAVHDDNLYFLVNGELMYGNLKHNYSDVLVKGYKLTGLKLHRGSFENFKYICEGLNCPFFCQLSLTAEVTCGCPSPLELVANKCICPKDHTNCAFPRCAGFKCNNSKCLRNNVRCNGVDDCGDNSDEMNCTKICSSDTHLCGNKCFDRDAVCGPVDIKVIDPMAGSKKMRTFYVLMIIWTVFVLLGYPGYLTLKWLCIKHGPRFLRLNSNISGFDMGYHELLEAENEPPHMMLAD
ncbi:Low-density lipoprotein receptor-related protein 4 [Thelohanellus kitauei]|uniref:Low-density lipoprotein receptor-related protein 4 n=1 Tax=Thelohanellus kitauei TaxID=669202 RepID=A0A0C2IZQ7_THEKT|nr:Low-density lipoprotein receptor-related protein 4 [Thelohanellus kitauei]